MASAEQLAIGLYRDGVSNVEITSRTGVSKPRLYYLLKKNGISPSRRPRHSPEVRQQIVAAFSRGLSPGQVAEESGVPVSTVRRYVSTKPRGKGSESMRRRIPGGRTKKDRYLYSTFGISEKTFDQMKKDQGNCCAVCGQSFESGEIVACVDHDHSNGTVRGICCSQCNVGLGNFRDRPSLLRRAARYLERSARSS